LKGLGALAGAAVAGRFALLPPSPSGTSGSPRELATRFVDSLSPEQSGRATVAFDHPLRQYHNRGVWGGGLWATPLGLSWGQRRIVADLVLAGLSPAGRQRVPDELFAKWPGVHAMRILVCGDPRDRYQVVITGPHLNLRIGGDQDGVAFGGPQVYGDQRGHGDPSLVGNLYEPQFALANRLFRSLRSDEQRAAVVATSPIQTDLLLRGACEAISGVRIGALSRESRGLGRELVDAIFSTYPADDVAYAWRCLDENGGVGGMNIAFFRDSQARPDAGFRNFRLEGPSAVLHFRGAPHVHAFVHVARDAASPLSVGEPLGRNPAALEGPAVKAWFEEAMRSTSGADLAFYPLESVAGRLRAGPLRSGDIYALESWQDDLVLVEVRGDDLRGELLADLRARGPSPGARRTYVVATTGHALESLGQPVLSRRDDGLLRDALVAHLRSSASLRG
jgi:hypothetical protein